MNCPSCQDVMEMVKIQSHYGQPIILEQCKRCGGVWFDESELSRARQGEAEKIESLDSKILKNPSRIEIPKLQCPTDQTTLIQFEDKYFPKSIVIEHCSTCGGFWLNRGEFTEYQSVRDDLQKKQIASSQDKKLKKEIENLLALHQQDSTVSILGKVGRFLSTPLDRHTLRPLPSAVRSPSENAILDMTTNVLIQILSFFT